MSLRPTLAICIPLLALAFGCPAQRTADPDPGEAGDSTVVAEFDDGTVTVAEVDAWMMEQLFLKATNDRDPSKLYEVRSEALDELIDQRLLEQAAAPRGLTTDELLREETEGQATVSDEELIAFYEENKERMGGATLEKVMPGIRRYLQQQRRDTAADQYIEALRASASIQVHLDAPRIEVAAMGPSLGPGDAPVTLIEFSDYRCGFCKRAQPVVEALLERYPSQLRFVHRSFPLNEVSRAAAEAAACANEQGQFWEFHRSLFASEVNLDAEGLMQHASELELDLEAFRVCVDERRYQAAVEADLAAGREAGVNGTPSFFVNGIHMEGARPFEDFVTAIEKELSRNPVPAPVS
jgi:protein-disulfide isomerase